MNIHFLELFYYVARYEGISEAVRNIPYGIQQPAMSSQVIQLEEDLGVILFHRRPFSLTPAGEELYGFIKPFFDHLEVTAEKLRGGVAQHIHIGASNLVLREYLPAILMKIRGKFPKMKLTLREGYEPELITLVQKREIDMAITLLEGKPASGIHMRPLFQLPIVLLVSRGSRLRSARDLWKMDRIEQVLISMPTNESIYRNFQKGLAKMGVDWFTSIEVNDLDLVETYVRKEFGIGLSVAIPGQTPNGELRVLPLEDFEPVRFGLMWHGKLTPILSACFHAIEEAARALSEEPVPPPRKKKAGKGLTAVE